MNDSAMVTVPCLVTVAAGAFAPGHLGELTRYLPFELADDVLEMNRGGPAHRAGPRRRRREPDLGWPPRPDAGCQQNNERPRRH